MWKNRKSEALNESMVFGIYRMRGKKVCEGWLIHDQPTQSYADTNRNFIESMQLFEMSLRDKNRFLKKLSTVMQFHNDIKLSKVERECLYYYFHGFSAKETALKMRLSFRTIQAYIANIKQCFDCKGQARIAQKKYFYNKRPIMKTVCSILYYSNVLSPQLKYIF